MLRRTLLRHLSPSSHRLQNPPHLYDSRRSYDLFRGAGRAMLALNVVGKLATEVPDCPVLAESLREVFDMPQPGVDALAQARCGKMVAGAQKERNVAKNPRIPY